MKVLVYFSGKLNEPKGTPIRVRNTIATLLRHGVEVHYAGHDGAEGVDVEHTLKLVSPLWRAFQLVSYVRRHHIDLVYMQTSAGLWFAPLLSWCTAARVGVDFHSRRFQEEHQYKKRPQWFTEFAESVELVLARTLDFATAVSQTLIDYYAYAVPHSARFPPGTDTKLFSPHVVPDKDTMDWKGESVLVAYAGNTKWYQGVETILSAFTALTAESPGRYKLLVIASSGLESVRAWVAEHKFDSVVRILGKQPHERIPAFLAAADVLTVVRPSDMVTEYSFPSKLPEYAALGKALVVSSVSDVGSYIQSGESGEVVPPGDMERTADALRRLAEPQYRARLGACARETALTHFDLDREGDKLYDFLTTVT